MSATRVHLRECASTNDEAARLAKVGAPHGTYVIADAQTAGRGREGRVWQSPPGSGLYFSIVLRPKLALHAVPPLTLAIGVAVCEACRAHGAPTTLKWPNDLLIDRAKLGGILVETQSQGGTLDAVIAGIGVNLGGDFPPELHAATLAAASGRAVDREAYLASLLVELPRWVDRYVAEGLPAIVPAWRDRMAHGLTARAIVDGAPLTGECVGLADDGALLLRAPDTGAIHRIRSGDVAVLR